ncbi:protein kinase [Streptomyces sp. NPDC059637]|uniref:protein kinase domain-containing protein n=1 Tax=Streptomyces sp. NPDC059637 TaxID=3347752 RepID=UPI00369170FF
MPLLEGDPDFVGGYRLESRLGSGGMGVVYLARTDSGRRMAVKVVREQLAEDPEFRARFRKEIDAARRVSGAWTAPVLDADPEAARPWMATLYVPGRTLSERIRQDGPLPVPELRLLATGLAEALRDIHRAGLVHRDLKPGNVLMAEDGPRVIDFGIARAAEEVSELTGTGRIVGTPPYLSPEQLRSPREAGPAADVFALAVTLVQACTGRTPFEAESPHMAVYRVVHEEPDLAAVPEPLLSLVRPCLAKRPEERPSPDDLLARLRAWPSEPGDGPSGDGPSGDGPSGAARQGTEAQGPEAQGPEADVPEAGGEPSGAGGGPAGVGGGAGPGKGGRGVRRRLVVTAAAAVLATAAAVLAAGGFGALRPADGRTAPTATGRERTAAWETRLGPEPGRPVCVGARGSLYCAAPGASAMRIDTATGKKAWVREDPSVTSAYDGSLHLSGGSLLVLGEKGLLALDPADGSERWFRDLSAYDNHEITGDTVLLLQNGRPVTALDSATGRQRWRHAVAAVPAPVVRTFAGRTYLLQYEPPGHAGTTVVVPLDARSGDAGEPLEFDGLLTAAGATEEALHLVQEGEPELGAAAVLRYDLRTGSTTRTQLPYEESALAVADGDTVYLQYQNGLVRAVDSLRGRAEVWTVNTGVSTASSLVAAGDRLYLSSSDGRLLAVDTGRGLVVAQTEARLSETVQNGLEEPGQPVLLGGRVYGLTLRPSVFSVEAGTLAE